MNNTILTDNKEIETLDLPSWWSDDFPCVATLLKTGFKGHRQLFAADVDVLPGVGFAFYEVQWLSKDGSSSDGPLTTIVPFNNVESIEQVEKDFHIRIDVNSQMSNALQTLRFEDTEVTALDCNTDEPVFVASPIAKKLAYESAKDMLRNLDSDEKGKHIVPTLGGEQEMSVITLPGLIHALNNRRPGAVKDEATRNMVIRFQRWVNHELVPTVMRSGRYEVQRPQHLLEAAHHERMMQVELLKASQGIVHPDFLEAKTRIVIARELGELPELDPKTRPLYTQDYLREKNLSAKQLRSKSGTFGKKLKAAYRERNGRDPQRADLTLPNGHIIQVYAYTEEDRPLFDRAWDELSQKAGA